MGLNASKQARVLLVILIVVSLIMSIVLSTTSFTGYIVTEEVNSGFNLGSVALFALGVFCTFVYLRKFRTTDA